MCSTPTALVEALVARGDEIRDVEILQTLTMGPAPFTDESWTGHFRLRTFFVSPNVRAAVNAGRASYAPVFLSYIPKLFLPEGPFRESGHIPACAERSGHDGHLRT